jgi:putative endonuclease
MYKVYVLRSLKTDKHYIGYTSKDLQERLAEHNRHCNKWDIGNSPFVLIYHEEFSNKQEAMKRERFLKSGQGRKLLKTQLADKISNH